MKVYWFDKREARPLTASRIKKQLKLYKKQVKEVTDSIIAQHEFAFEEALKEFITVAGYRIPVWTGMSKASLMPLADHVGLSGWVERLINENDLKVEDYYKLMTGSIIIAPKTPEVGYRLGINSYHWSLGTRGGRQYSFRFDIPIWQWQENERDWQALAEAEIIFDKTLEAILKENTPQTQSFLDGDEVPF